VDKCANDKQTGTDVERRTHLDIRQRYLKIRRGCGEPAFEGGKKKGSDTSGSGKKKIRQEGQHTSLKVETRVWERKKTKRPR